MDKIERAEEMAEEARRLLTNELLNEAMDAIIARHLEREENSAPEDRETREDAWRMRRAVREVRNELRSVIRDFAHKRKVAQRRGIAD